MPWSPIPSDEMGSSIPIFMDDTSNLGCLFWRFWSIFSTISKDMQATAEELENAREELASSWAALSYHHFFWGVHQLIPLSLTFELLKAATWELWGGWEDSSVAPCFEAQMLMITWWSGQIAMNFSAQDLDPNKQQERQKKMGIPTGGSHKKRITTRC